MHYPESSYLSLQYVNKCNVTFSRVRYKGSLCKALVTGFSQHYPRTPGANGAPWTCSAASQSSMGAMQPDFIQGYQYFVGKSNWQHASGLVWRVVMMKPVSMT
ncbi:hypothetical protein BV898_13378 [Hypsibius exemplaris]|uniref:Uncharacterized protein n=1 Tax=Hypsibius exemplaris TaxID=2072580 RepID=A0A1W0WB04_HYPEX|nr:hypothetical protein BV898_13378 [Hypsibius exemplaris]